MECPICYNIITNSCFGSCSHHFCNACLINWCKHLGTTCPVCKTFISEIKPDIEFDNLTNQIINNNNNNNTNSIIIDNSTLINREIVINHEQRDLAGITLKNNYNQYNRAPGVMISNIDTKYKCYKSGLRKNDIILNINNIPCINHKQSIDIINHCTLSGRQIICRLL